MADIPGRELLEVDEVAEFLGVGPVTVYRWCREGRLPCIKLGRVWRIRRGALHDFLQRREQSGTLVGQLKSFLTVPDHVIVIAEDEALLRRVDASFFQVAEAREGTMVKFYAVETASAATVRAEFLRNGLDARRLEAEGRLHLTREHDILGGRAQQLRKVIEEHAGEGRTIWASFDWVHSVNLDEALRQQEELRELVDARQLVIKTAVLQEQMDGWPPDVQRRAQQLHRGTIWISSSGLWLSRAVPLPRA